MEDTSKYNPLVDEKRRKREKRELIEEAIKTQSDQELLDRALPVDLIHYRKLVIGDFIFYKKIVGDKIYKAYVDGFWKHEAENVEGIRLFLNFRKLRWTIEISTIEWIKKRINPAFYFEFQYLRNLI